MVTGGGSGMGRIAAVRLAREGAAVAVVDIDELGLKETRRMGGPLSSPTRATSPTSLQSATWRPRWTRPVARSTGY
jgi:NAD(P)-dependent dehydrogenase (short-subunit alcohol dehydrogenase family)